MCGILAFLCAGSGSPRLTQQLLDALSSRQSHRGPDGRGVRVGAWWGLAHERLSIMDPVDHANQPMSGTGELDGLHVVHNGEIYNFRDLYAALAAEGYVVKPQTSSDSEVILHCYKHWGADKTVRMLRGMFAFVLVDEKKGEFLAARDHVGIKPLYQGKAPNGDQAFSSELKGVFDQFATTSLVLPGRYITKAAGEVQYYDPEWDCDSFVPRSVPTAETVRESLKRAVRMRMMSDVPYGAFLSGGLDSCIVTSLMIEIGREETEAAIERGEVVDDQWFTFHTGGKLKTFTVGMEGSPDIVAARAMSEALGSDHYEALFKPEDGFRIIPQVVHHMETYEPELIRSSITNYILAEMTSKHVKVVLTGEGADEPFCGYQYFKDAPDADALQKESRRIYHHLHCVNLQRSDRMGMAHGLEARVPFLDIDFLQTAFSVDPKLKLIGEDGLEKKFLRECFASTCPIPRELISRTKAMQCEGVGLDWVAILQADIESNMSDEHFLAMQKRYTIKPPQSKEECLYRDLFQEYFPEQDLFVHVWEGGCRAGGASWKSTKYTRFGLCDVDSLRHGLMGADAPEDAQEGEALAKLAADRLDSVAPVTARL